MQKKHWLFLFSMRAFAEKFYKSTEWKKCRESYARSVGYMCEECAKQGISTTGEIVHHKKHIQPNNINNPTVTLDWNNLELLCRNCHAKQHDGKAHRFKVDEMGNVIMIGR